MTIIVLLILAGVVISLTVGNRGLFSRAKNGAETYEEAEAREKLELILANIALDKQTKSINIVPSTEGCIEKEKIKTYASKLGEKFISDIQNTDGTWKYNNVT